MIALAVIAGLLVMLAAFTLYDRRVERRQLLATIDALARRIQAPQMAAIEVHNDSAQPLYAPPAVNPFSDDEYWESRELLAERLMREEVDAPAANT